MLYKATKSAGGGVVCVREREIICVFVEEGREEWERKV